MKSRLIGAVVVPLATTLAFGLTIALPDACANNIVYNVNFDTSLGDHISGSITTDGTLGNLDPSNIVDWSFSSAGPDNWSSHNVGTPTFCLYDGCPLAATSNDLLENTGLPSGYYGIEFEAFPPPAGSSVYVVQLTLSNEPTYHFGEIVDESLLSGYGSDRFAATTIATAETPTTSSVPEPATTWLIGIGLIGLVGLPRRLKEAAGLRW